MKKLIIFLMLCATPCFAQSQRIDAGLSGIINSIIRNGANVAAGGRFDARVLANEMIYVGSSEMQQGVYDRYYENIRERHRQEATEREYEIWAEREDRKNGLNDKESEFRRRYYGR